AAPAVVMVAAAVATCRSRASLPSATGSSSCNRNAGRSRSEAHQAPRSILLGTLGGADDGAVQARGAVLDVGPDDVRGAAAEHDLREAGGVAAPLQYRDLQALVLPLQVRAAPRQPQRLAVGVLADPQQP